MHLDTPSRDDQALFIKHRLQNGFDDAHVTPNLTLYNHLVCAMEVVLVPIDEVSHVLDIVHRYVARVWDKTYTVPMHNLTCTKIEDT